MVFQNYALFPHMSVRENVGFGLRMRGTPRADSERRVARALELVQLRGHEEKLPGQLSGGQQQRVAIARAIVIEPPLVLMDEPLSNLDARLRLEMRAEIRRIHDLIGSATIYVTHDQEEALSLADRIVVMREGVVQQIDSPQQVYAQPANLHVARFMGYRNVLELDVAAVNGDRVELAGDAMRIVGTLRQPLGGGRAAIAIRPEEIVVGARDGVANAVRGRVTGVEYGGRDSLIEVALDGGAQLFVRSDAPAARGDVIALSIAPERALVYPA